MSELGSPPYASPSARIEPIRVAVVDDEQPARLRLVGMLGALPNVECVAQANDGSSAIKMVDQHHPDVVLMDIRMPGVDGLQAASRLAQFDRPPAVIFCTAFDEHALEAFNANAIGYLLKPIKSEHLQTALEKASILNPVQLKALSVTEGADGVSGAARSTHLQDNSLNNAGKNHLVVKTIRGEERIAIDDICALIADKKYVSAHLKQSNDQRERGVNGREVLLDQSLRSLELEWPQRFIRVHRNALVAKQAIMRIENDKNTKDLADGAAAHHSVRVVLADTHVSPVVSRRHLADIRRLFRKT